MLHTRPVVDLRNRYASADLASRRRLSGQATDLDAILAGRSDDLARVELQRGHRVVVLERLEDPARTHVPNLFGDSKERSEIGMQKSIS